jgi:hypothetical protein
MLRGVDEAWHEEWMQRAIVRAAGRAAKTVCSRCRCSGWSFINFEIYDLKGLVGWSARRTRDGSCFKLFQVSNPRNKSSRGYAH